jgi:hypothetical protein
MTDFIKKEEAFGRKIEICEYGEWAKSLYNEARRK